MDKEGGFPPGVLQIGIDNSSLELQAKLDEEYGQLVRNRQQLCTFIFPRTDGLTPHHMPANPYWIIQNAVQIFPIDRQNRATLSLHTLLMQSRRSQRGYLLYLATTHSAEGPKRMYHLHSGCTYARRSQHEFHLNPGRSNGCLARLKPSSTSPLLIPVRCVEFYLPS